MARWLWRCGRRGLMAVLLVVVLGAAPLPVASQPVQGDPAFLPEAGAGFDGLSKAGRWLTVRAVVANEGPPLEGELRVTARPGLDAVYTQRVELAARARKLVTLQVPGPASSGDVRLTLRAGDLDLASRDVPVRMLSATDFLVGVMTDDGAVPAGLGAVRRGGNPVGVARLAPADLPSDPLALQALDALIVRQASSDRLTPDQQRAVRSWVEQGGQLVVAGGPGWRRSMEGFDDLLPIAGLWTRQVKHLRAFSRYAGAAPPEGDVLVTLGSPIEGARVLLAQEGIPLLTERWVGLGRVTYVGPDPAIEPFRSWPAAESLWQRVLVGGRPGLPTLDANPSNASALRGVLGELLDLGLPATGWVIGFLAAYVLLIGPAHYLVLRRADRREWAWITFPLLAFGAAGLLLGSAAALRGPDVRVAALSIVRVVEGARSAPADTYLGFVAPTRGSYTLALTDGAVPRPVADGSAGVPVMTIEPGPGGGPTRLPELRLEGRVQRTIQVRSHLAISSPIYSELRATNGRLEGQVRNIGNDRLEDVIVIAAGEAVGLGDLDPGEGRALSLSLPTNRASGVWQNGPPPWALPSARTGPGGDRRRALLAQLVQPGRGGDGESTGGALLLAWGQARAPEVTFQDGTIVGAARRLVELALPVEYGDPQVTIPPGLLGRTILDGAALGRGSVSSFVARGPIVFQFDLPPGLELARIDRLSVHLATPGRPVGAPATLPAIALPPAPGAPAPRLSLFRWADRTWVDVPLAGTGVSNMPFGAAFVDAGAIRARMEPQGAEVQVDQLDLSLEGVRP